MEGRKLIQFGKSAYCITIPRTWLGKNNICKGDTLSIHETVHNSIEVLPMNSDAGHIKDITIDISSKSNSEIMQLFLSAYLIGYTSIIFTGIDEERVAYIRKRSKDLMAVEVMEVTPTKMTLSVFWDINTMNLSSIITRISHINSTILAEAIELIESGNMYKDIIEKGSEVQKQVYLAQRAITSAVNNSVTAHKFHLSSLELLYVSYRIHFFGLIGEYILKLAKVINDINYSLNNHITIDYAGNKFDVDGSSTHFDAVVFHEDLKHILSSIALYHSKVLEAHYKSHEDTSFVFSEFVDIEEDIEIFRFKHAHLLVPLIAEYSKMILLQLKESEFVMITTEQCPRDGFYS